MKVENSSLLILPTLVIYIQLAFTQRFPLVTQAPPEVAQGGHGWALGPTV